MADDRGFSDISWYCSEIDTRNLNRIAQGGLRFTQFYNCARCCPTRASLTGLYPHQAGFGLMTADDTRSSFLSYQGDLSDQCVTIAEVLKESGYHTLMCGKWHLTPPDLPSKHNWPVQRGFERFYGTILGASSYFDFRICPQRRTLLPLRSLHFPSLAPALVEGGNFQIPGALRRRPGMRFAPRAASR